jgi:OOP family OmpA-OmpF porin
VLAAVILQLQELDRLLASSGRRARLEILGRADSDGPDALNAELSRARANQVLAVIRGAALTRIDMSARGLGRAPVAAGATEAEHEHNRRVSFDVRVIDDPMALGAQR